MAVGLDGMPRDFKLVVESAVEAINLAIAAASFSGTFLRHMPFTRILC